MFKLVLICLIPLLVNSQIYRNGSPPICLSETNNACQEEIKKKNETLERISHIYPPLTDSLKNYKEQCRNVMENLFTADTIFKTEKTCVLNIGQGVCKTDDFNFLQDNYDGLIELYTNNPASDIDRWDHPSEKFYRMHCDVLRSDFVQKSLNIRILSVNQKNADVQKVLEIGQSAQKCLQKSLIVYGNDNYYKMFIKKIQAFPAVMTDIFKHRPRLSEYQCLFSFSWFEFFREVVECMDVGNAEKCVLAFMTPGCQEEILADFQNLTVIMRPRNQSKFQTFHFLCLIITRDASLFSL
ncbi:hypothetical protein CRE_11211 [Caenorhabditis remanei]|uniref:DUF19 domain-containing protein n=1 Tax=Caenorhabditis remanei TaxID=31234 RepID=E3MQD6_CAERE|nr:hypothetical protein CRE_11211 [Caenorhabditis remanei]